MSTATGPGSDPRIDGDGNGASFDTAAASRVEPRHSNTLTW